MSAAVIDIDGYVDVERIGQGGVGVVYRATRSSTGAVVAVKVLRDVSDASVAWHRARRELTALLALAGHSNVIQLFELFDLEQGPAFSMEFAPGGSVADLLQRRDDVLTLAETVLIGRQTADALAAAHARGIVHRDIKPQNLLIDAYGQIKLCDFGIASLIRANGFRTRTSAWSMRYASPEDLDGDVEVGSASDVYSLGATLLHVAHGAPPSLKDRLVEWVPPDTEDSRQAELDEVLAACLQPDPDRRPSAADLAERLERLDWSLDQRCRSLPVDPPVTPDVGRVPCGRRPHGVGVASLTDSARPLIDTAVGGDADDTVLRGARRPPPRPSVTTRRRRRWPALVTATAVLASTGLAALMWERRGSGWSDDARSSTTPALDASSMAARSTQPHPPVPTVDPTSIATDLLDVAETGSRISLVDRPAGLIAIDDASVVWPFGAAGECLVQTFDVVELQPVGCNRPHDLQRISVAELDGDQFPPGAGFDEASVQLAVESACLMAFESFVAPDIHDVVVDLPVTRPSAATWQQGDRRFQCLLGVAGQHIVGDGSDPAGTTDTTGRGWRS